MLMGSANVAEILMKIMEEPFHILQARPVREVLLDTTT